MAEPLAIARHPAPGGGLEGRIAALDRAIDAAALLGLDVTRASSVAAGAAARLTLPVEAFVLALVGGTGVGKSSLLNALAGAEVSRVGLHRPTTDRPVAWVSERERTLDELLTWLDVDDVRAVADERAENERAQGGVEEDTGVSSARADAADLARPDDTGAADAAAGSARDADDRQRLAVLDLPDLDSIDVEHRARVEALLPRVDAVVWVADPEKYADALLHDEFLRLWAPRLGRQAFVLNKVDLVPGAGAYELAADVRRLLAVDGLSMPVIRTAAARGAESVGDLRRWLDELAGEKAVAVARLQASIADAVAELAAQAGIDGTGSFRPLVPEAARDAAVDATVSRLEGIASGRGDLTRVAVDATAHVAADTAGPLARLRRLALGVGLGAPRLTPHQFLIRWRDRASALGAAEPATRALGNALLAAPSALRPHLAAETQPLAVAGRLEAVLDALPAVVAADDRPPRSGAWRAAGLLQLFAVAVVLLAGGWLVAGLIPAIGPFVPRAPGDVGSYLVVAVAVAVVASVLVRAALGVHARMLGRRWGARLTRTTTGKIRAATPEAIFGPVDRLEEARVVIARAAVETALVSPPGTLGAERGGPGRRP